MPHGCIFAQFSHKDCQESVSISNMSFALSSFPVFYWSWQSHIKAPREAQKYKEELDPFLTSEGQPGTWMVPLSGPPGFISWWLESEWNRGGAKYQTAFGAKLSGLVPTCHPSYHLPLSLFVMQSLNQQQRLLWFLGLRRSLQNHWSSQFLF